MTQKIINRLEQLVNYLEPLLVISNCHMVDFFTQNIYQQFISVDIQQEIDNFGPEQTLNYILYPDLQTDTHFTNLKKLLTDCKSHTLANSPNVCLNLQDLQLKLIDLGCDNLSGARLDIFMNSKKSHEVEVLSEISSAVFEIAKTHHIVDIGDGKGYLSSTLALFKNLKVLGIDSSDINTKNAAKRNNKLKKVYKNDCQTHTESENYKQTTKYVTEDANLINLVQEYFPNDCVNYLSLVGLHTCGNLASSCLRIFVNNPSIKSVCNVGCCYHLLTEDSPNFPMSEYLRGKQFNLGRNARMLSCQSLDRILDKKELPSEILFYRSLLQILILKYCPELMNMHVGKFKKPTTFFNYVQTALKKFNSNVTIPDSEINTLYETYQPLEKTLQIFYLIRAHIAPVIESVILLDRLLFLHENNLSNSFLVQLFDPVISPRCFGLVAFKNECFT